MYLEDILMQFEATCTLDNSSDINISIKHLMYEF